MGDLTPPSSSFYWFPQSEEQVPLKQWYEVQTLPSGSGNASTICKTEDEDEEEEERDGFNGGIMGHGIGFSRILAAMPGLYELAPHTQSCSLHACGFPDLRGRNH